MWDIRSKGLKTKNQITNKVPSELYYHSIKKYNINYQHQVINNHIKSLPGKYVEGKHNTLKVSFEPEIGRI